MPQLRRYDEHRGERIIGSFGKTKKLAIGAEITDKSPFSSTII